MKKQVSKNGIVSGLPDTDNIGFRHYTAGMWFNVIVKISILAGFYMAMTALNPGPNASIAIADPAAYRMGN